MLFLYDKNVYKLYSIYIYSIHVFAPSSSMFLSLQSLGNLKMSPGDAGICAGLCSATRQQLRSEPEIHRFIRSFRNDVLKQTPKKNSYAVRICINTNKVLQLLQTSSSEARKIKRTLVLVHWLPAEAMWPRLLLHFAASPWFHGGWTYRGPQGSRTSGAFQRPLGAAEA